MAEDLDAPNGQPWVFDALPPDSYDDSALQPEQQHLLAPGVAFPLEQIDQTKFTGPFRLNNERYDITIPGAVVAGANARTWLVVQVASRQPGPGLGTFRRTDQGREPVSDSEFFLLDPSASDGSAPMRIGAGSALVLDAQSGDIVTAGGETVEPAREDEGPVRGLKIIVAQGGGVLVSNRSDSEARLVTPHVVSEAPTIEQEVAGAGDGFATDTAEPHTETMIDQPEAVPEVHRPTAAEIFTDAAAFNAALADPLLDTATRSQLMQLQEAWTGLRAVAEGDEFWDERIRGNLLQLTEVLDTMRYSGRTLEEAIEQAQQDLGSLRTAFDHGDYEYADNILRRYRPGESLLEDARLRIRRLDEQGLDVLDRQLQWNAIEADERYVRMRRYAGEPDPNSTEQMVAELRGRLSEDGDLQRLAGGFMDEYGYRVARWQQRRDALEVLAELSHRTQNQVLEPQVSRAIYEWENVYPGLQRATEERRRGDDQDISYVRSLLYQPLEEAQFFRRLAQLTELAAEEAR